MLTFCSSYHYLVEDLNYYRSRQSLIEKVYVGEVLELYQTKIREEVFLGIVYGCSSQQPSKFTADLIEKFIVQGVIVSEYVCFIYNESV